MLLSGLGSSVSEVTLTTLTIVALVALTLVSMTKTTGVPTSKSPIVQTLFSYLPTNLSPLATRTKIKPLGKTSLTVTLTATSGPLFTTVIVQLTRVLL